MPSKDEKNHDAKHPGDYLKGDKVDCPESRCGSKFEFLSSLPRHLIKTHKYSSIRAREAKEAAKSEDGKILTLFLSSMLIIHISMQLLSLKRKECVP